MSKFYEFRQNNSGGTFDFDKQRGISISVIIEASTPDEANRIAGDIGIYFNGCDRGMDCKCCGDRWCPVDGEYDVIDAVSELYVPRDGYMGLSPAVFVHFRDGSVKPGIESLPFYKGETE